MSASQRHSLLRRLLVRTGVVVLALLVASGAISYFIALHYSNEVHDRWLDDSARTLAAQIKYVAQRPALDLPEVALQMFVWDAQDEIYYEVIAGNNLRIAGNAEFADLPSLVGGEGRRFFDATLSEKRVRAVIVGVKSPAGNEIIKVVVGETLNKRSMLAREILFATVPVQLLLIMLGGIALWWGLRGGLRVVASIAAAIRVRDPADSHAIALPAAAPSEIEPLVTALNNLIDRVNHARRAQQRFVSNAAHQLRTPVATLQIQTERALRERDAEEQAHALAHVDVAIRRLGHLLHQILTLARLEPEARGRVPLVPCDIIQVARDVVEQHVDIALARSMDIGLAAPTEESVVVAADRTLVSEMLANLIDNAVQHGRVRGRITVGVAERPPCLYVEDDGPGIAPEERERVWDRFYRVPGTQSTGSGLGLSIVREIAELHAATVRIESSENGSGTRITVEFGSAKRDCANPVPPAHPMPRAATATRTCRITAQARDDRLGNCLE